MNAQNFTQKTLEAIQTAQAMAQENRNNYIEPEHLLYALVDQDGGLIPSLLGRMGVDCDAVLAELDTAIAALPLAEKREQAGDILDILELCARDLMVIQDSDGAIIQTDIEEKLRQQRFTGSRMLSDIMEARRMLSSNVAWQSVLEMLFFKMAGG